MIRGNLKILVLRTLEKQATSGYGLMKHIGEVFGSKPSPGSIYPVLDELAKQRFITAEQDGRKKMYSLTKEGKNRLKEISKQNDFLVETMRSSIKIWGAMTGDDMSPFTKTVELINKGKIKLEQIPPEMAEFKLEMTRLFHEEKFQKNKKKIVKILNKAIGQLKKIK